jgi:hypothetical protein
MLRTAARVLLLSTSLLALACGGDDPAAAPPEGGSNGSGAGGADGSDDTTVAVSSSSSATTGAGGATGSTGATGGGDPGGAPGLSDLGTLVVLGDSISDGGGEAPYYYELLLTDLEAHYGKPIVYENYAQAGSTTLFLDGQLSQLPDELEGPVAVVITSGGNNMQYNVVQILAGADQMARDRMAGHIDDALTDLLAPDRFGAGVDVHVYEANVYDASDGEGDFGSNGCALPLDAPDGSTEIFASWNAAIEEQITVHQQTLIDIHSHFTGHGYASAANWYADDCVHPNAPGHEQISQLVFDAITGS